MGNIHNTKKRVEKTLDRILKSDYSKDEKQELKDFKKHLEAEGCSETRIDSYLNSFITLEHFISSKLLHPEKRELKRIVAKINNNELKEEDYSIWSLHEYKKTLRKFYQYYNNEKNPEILDFMTTNVKNSKKPMDTPEELPNPDSIRKMVKTRDKLRNSTLIIFTFDSGGRIGEVLNVQWRDITFKEKGAKVKFRKSKSMKRQVPIYESVDYLEKWKENTPKSEPNDYVFVNISKNGLNKKYYGNQMNYESARKIFKGAGEDINANFKTNPHAFRKSKATYLASKGLSAVQLCEFFGWHDFKTAKTYIRLAEKDLENAIENIEVNKDKKDHRENNKSNKEKIGEAIIDLVKNQIDDKDL